MLIHWIWLATRSGLGDRGRMTLLQKYGDAEDIFFASDDAFAAVPGLSEEAVQSLQDRQLDGAERILADCARENIRILCWPDAAYPARLRSIADPPVVLYFKGRLPEFDRNPLIGVVGTRRASAYGLTVAKRMGYQIAACGGLVVSGMAFGIDGMAMRGALTAGGSVVGVLGCGADVVYPASNRSLFADVEQNGCLLTEFAPGTPPAGWNFPRRNRIISGLSCGVLVVEAPEKSGALITARQAADQGRDVFVVPGNIDVDSCKGSNALLRDGAIAVSSGWDVVGEYEARFPGRVHMHTGNATQSAYPDEVVKAAQAEKELPKVAQKTAIPRKSGQEQEKGKKKEIDNGPSAPYSDADTQIPGLSAAEQTVVQLLRQGTELVDDILAASGMETGKVLAALTMLEIRGLIRRLPGKRIAWKR